MTDTVTRLLALADAFAGSYAVHGNTPASMDIRQALEAELTRLFTPSSDEQIRMHIPEGDGWKFEVGFGEAIAFAKTIENLHGIGGEA